MLEATLSTVTLFVALVLTLLAFGVGAFICDRRGRMFIAAFLSACAWASAAVLALLTWLVFRK